MGGAGRRPGWWSVLLVLGVLLTGCVSRDVDSAEPTTALPRYYDVAQLSAAISERLGMYRTARLSVRGEIAGQPAATQVSGDGVIRLAGDGVSAQFTQSVRRPGAPPVQTEFLVVPGQVYQRHAESGPPWVLVDAGSADSADRRRAILADAIADSGDPTANLVRYADATLVADAADDVVDGIAAVRYELVVDLARAAVLEPDPALRVQLEQQVRAGFTRITSTLWVDAANRPVGSHTRQELPGVGTLTLTSRYRDWGRPVQIAAPPPGRTR
ncbi:hypothetical protein [Pseudonocardia hispaniensis]